MHPKLHGDRCICTQDPRYPARVPLAGLSPCALSNTPVSLTPASSSSKLSDPGASLLGQRSGGPKAWLAAEAGTVLGTSPSPRGGCWLQQSVTGCVKPWDPQRYLQSPKEPKTCLEWRTSHVVSDVWVTMSWSQGQGPRRASDLTDGLDRRAFRQGFSTLLDGVRCPGTACP